MIETAAIEMKPENVQRAILYECVRSNDSPDAKIMMLSAHAVHDYVTRAFAAGSGGPQHDIDRGKRGRTRSTPSAGKWTALNAERPCTASAAIIIR